MVSLDGGVSGGALDVGVRGSRGFCRRYATARFAPAG